MGGVSPRSGRLRAAASNRLGSGSEQVVQRGGSTSPRATGVLNDTPLESRSSILTCRDDTPVVLGVMEDLYLLMVAFGVGLLGGWGIWGSGGGDSGRGY